MFSALATLLVAAPTQIFIATGATDFPSADKLKAALSLPAELVMGPDYPRVINSRNIEGLKPGFFVVVLGTCMAETPEQKRYAAGLAALVQRRLKGSYTRAVDVDEREMECPSWIADVEGGGETIAYARKHTADVKGLLAAARLHHKKTSLLGAAILVREILALDPTNADAASLGRTVELLLEDMPPESRLP